MENLSEYPDHANKIDKIELRTALFLARCIIAHAYFARLRPEVFIKLRLVPRVQMSGKLKQRQLAILATLLFCLPTVTLHAATVTVINTNDDGPGSLRQALRSANDGDTINFAVTGTITLTSGGLPVNKNVTISGPGNDQLSIDGNQAALVLGVFPEKTAEISGLTISNAQTGIWNFGTLAVSNCVLSGNLFGLSNRLILAASNCVISNNSGDGIYNDHAILSVSDCVINGNLYSGIFNFNPHGPSSSVQRGNDRRDVKIDGFFPGEVTIANTIISDNSQHGVYNIEGPVTILDSTLSGNSAGQDNSGGGIYTSGAKLPGNVMVINSTISGNFAFGDGGGISAGFSGLTIINSTISGNSVGNPVDGFGGGIAPGYGVAPPALTITNSTVNGNSAATCGGICGGTVGIGNTVLNANASGNIDGIVTSRGYNVCSDDGGGLLTGPGDQTNTDPLLGPLQDNGGPTLTHLPLPGSPAIDAGDPNFTPPPFHDQRGPCYYRVFGRRIDVGSVETQPRPRCVTPAPRPSP
jgi:hypothetical protein